MCTEKGMEEHTLNLILVISREQNLEIGERLSVFSLYTYKNWNFNNEHAFFLPYKRKNIKW